MKKSIKIDGMSCHHCVMAVQSALEAVEGVSGVSVQLGSADVEFDPQRTNEASLIEAIEEEGYQVVPD